MACCRELAVLQPVAEEGLELATLSGLDRMDHRLSGPGCRRGRSPRDGRGVKFLPHG